MVLLYSALFTCISENREWKLGETIVDAAFDYVPQTHQKVLWEAKMLYLSKLGKNVLQAISNMKEGNAALQAKVWIKLARSSANEFEQHSAYNKAIEILRKEESIEVVEVLIEFSEWLHRNKYPSQDVEDQLLLAVDTLMDIEPGWDEEEDEGDVDDDYKVIYFIYTIRPNDLEDQRAQKCPELPWRKLRHQRFQNHQRKVNWLSNLESWKD